MFDKLFTKSLDTDNPMNGMVIGICLAGAHMVIALLAVMILVFFQGLMNLLPWVLASFAVLIIGAAALIWTRLKHQGRELAELMDHPAVRGREFELKLLGGVASLKVGAPIAGNDAETLAVAASEAAPQLEDPETMRRRELEKLAQLRREELISAQEYATLKAGLLHAAPQPTEASRPARTIETRTVEPDIRIL